MTTKQSTTPKQSTRSAGSKAPARRAKGPAEPTQLRLLDGGRTTRKAWQLDARTRHIGSQRVAEAREILRRAQPPEPNSSHHEMAG